MTRLKKSFLTKFISFLLCSLTLLGFIIGAFGTVIMMKYNVYTENPDKVLSDNLENIAFEYAWEIGLSASGYLIYDDGTVYGEGHAQKSLVPYLENTFPSVYFEVCLPDETVLISNYQGEEYRFQCECTDRISIKNETGKIVLPSDTELYYDTEKTEESTALRQDSYHPHENEILTEIRTKVYVKEKFKNFDKMYFTEKLIETMYSVRFFCPVLTVILFFLSLLFLVFLLYSAGFKKNSPSPENGTLEKIPFDILTAFFVLLGVLEALFFSEYISYSSTAFVIAITCTLVYCDILLILTFLYSFAIRCKTGTVLKNTVIYKVLKVMFKGFAKTIRFFAQILQGLPLIWKTVLAVSTIFVSELLIIFLWILWQADGAWLFFWWFTEKLILIPFILYIAIQMKHLKNGCREISLGNLSYKINTKKMPPELREHGENLNSIGNGMAAAVEEKLKSERLKTELITNVSHDIKTPLTSIINYVDLLKKEEPENEKSKEYVSILERQCARLKKLLYDLVEASKASTGNIPVNLTSLDAPVLIGQVLGEYETRLKESGLELIFSEKTKPIRFSGDGNLMWRVLDNLMSNICKYAQKGTRVYVNLEEEENTVVMTFKNISKNPLNISGQELMERFVRADSSRNSEGSGLGLSIAQSLTSLQGGYLDISVDGDLFKATVKMKKE